MRGISGRNARDFWKECAGFLEGMLMCGKVTHKNLIDSSPLLFRTLLKKVEKGRFVWYNEMNKVTEMHCFM